ncbi:unnamed protein product [Phaedon cochleariae]|uniref:G-protein coupled receptors family 2 profile 2 domain-containing protein n=1 Tax=Phaedon cochleariae TaxID=80249 RepID=A0A9P0DEC3_PHACE|nr:unnamed protein product [Phaedon cochleariae]
MPRILPLVSLVLTLNLHGITSEQVKKCCGPEEVFRSVQNTFQCVQDITRRVQLRADATDVAHESQGTHRCVEALNGEFYEFNVTEGRVGLLSAAARDHFPKCCPLNFTYDSQLHACSDQGYSRQDFFAVPFVKVGLPNCKVVTDVLLKPSEYGLLDSTLRSSRYPGSYCIDKNEEEELVLRECKDSIEACEGLKCVKKCCPDGKSFANKARCVDTYKYGLNLTVFGNIIENPDDNYSIIYNRTCKQIYMMRGNQFKFTLDRNGKFTEFTKKGNLSEDVYNMNSYCIEHSQGRVNGYFFFRCFQDQESILSKFDITFWPLVLSCIFLVLTIFVYVVLKETKKMFGKILVNYCVAMLFVFTSLTVAQMNNRPGRAECRMKAFSIIFFGIASFTWSNIMCCDIWCTFGSTRRYLGRKQKSVELKKLLFYSLYGWGTPFLLTLVIVLFYNWRVLPYPIQPLMAEVRCFFDRKDGNYAKVLFFDVPLLIIQLVNMVLFMKTVTYCIKVKDEINRVNDTTKDDKKKKYQGDKERLFLILKLMVIMGMSYIFETISAFFDMSEAGVIPKYIEIVWDTINAFQGVFIFIIFICKKKILARCLEKFHLIDASHISSSSSVHTQSSLTLNGFSMNTLGSTNKKMSK